MSLAKIRHGFTLQAAFGHTACGCSGSTCSPDSGVLGVGETVLYERAWSSAFTGAGLLTNTLVINMRMGESITAKGRKNNVYREALLI